MPDPDFFDFMMEGGFDLLFPDDESVNYKCPFCGRVIKGNEEVQWLKKNAVFKCPKCGKELEIK